MLMRTQETEDQISNEIEAHYREWRLEGIGEDTVWIAPGSTPHPDLADWCTKWEFNIEEYGIPAPGEGPDV